RLLSGVGRRGELPDRRRLAAVECFGPVRNARGMRRSASVILVVAAVVALGLVPSLAPPFYANLLVPFYGYAIALLGFNLLFGYGGLLSFGHAMFLGLGAYGAAVIAGVWGIRQFEIVLIGAALGGFVVALPLGWLAV